MHNNGVFNPAYFDLGNQLTATMFYRKQWLQIEGAPTTKSLVAGVELGRHLINLNIYQDDITIFKDSKIGMGYNYRINLGEKSLLSF